MEKIHFNVFDVKVSNETVYFTFLVTSKTIEELKRSVSSLKLPKEHSPRV